MALPRAAFALAALAGAALAASPVPGFRAPATPLLSQSPLINAFAPADTLNEGNIVHWTGADLDWFAGLLVDNSFYLIMGNPAVAWAAAPLARATQTSVTVFATQTVYTFAAGPVAVNLTFTSPQIAGDYDLMSRPCHYFTYSLAATDGAPHAVSLYQDVTSYLVLNDGKDADITFSRVPLPAAGAEALSLGAATQLPLSSTNDKPTWGFAYLVRDTTVANSAVLESSYVTRKAFAGGAALPAPDSPTNPQPQSGGKGPATGPQPGKDRAGSDLPGFPVELPSADPNLCWAKCNATAACLSWAYAVPGCDQYAKPQCWLKGSYGDVTDNKCRVSGAQAGWPMGGGATLAAAAVYALPALGATPVVRRFMVAVDEILGIDWFGESMPPWWRRALPVNSTAVVPTDMLAQGWSSAGPVTTLCDDFDAATALKLSAAGGDEYATVAQLTYRQVWAGQMLVFSPVRNSMWYFLKEISSCGCLQTADVIYPAFPQVLYYDPELAKLWMITHLEYAMNRTSEPYPMPWAPHHLGYWPIADLPASRQENMPLEETAWDLLIIAAIAQRQGGDLTWLEPYWPAIQTWYSFLITLLPFPQEQLSTDDFDGPLYNATNLAVKGIASIAAYGYSALRRRGAAGADAAAEGGALPLLSSLYPPFPAVIEKYTGNASAAAEAYATAAAYAKVMVQYSWNANGTDSHFMIGYVGSQKDGGDPGSWPMLYNALWLRVLGFEDLVPQALLDTQRDWYAANKMQQYGLPLNSRKLYTKDDWMTFLAATYYTHDAAPAPSAFSNALFNGLFRFANETTSREALSDWTNTDSPTAVGFVNRPVYGAMWAPVLVAEGPALGLGRLGNPGDESLERASRIFKAAWAESA